MKWIAAVNTATPTPTGTVVLVALLVILGFQFLLNAITLDINNVPTEPLQGLIDDEEYDDEVEPPISLTDTAEALEAVPTALQIEDNPTLRN